MFLNQSFEYLQVILLPPYPTPYTHNPQPLTLSVNDQILIHSFACTVAITWHTRGQQISITCFTRAAYSTFLSSDMCKVTLLNYVI